MEDGGKSSGKAGKNIQGKKIDGGDEVAQRGDLIFGGDDGFCEVAVA